MQSDPWTVGINQQASPRSKGMGRKLRRARNIVKKWQADFAKREQSFSLDGHSPNFNDVLVQAEIRNGRYERAAALIHADTLRNS